MHYKPDFFSYSDNNGLEKVNNRVHCLSLLCSLEATMIFLIHWVQQGHPRCPRWKKAKLLWWWVLERKSKADGYPWKYGRYSHSSQNVNNFCIGILSHLSVWTYIHIYIIFIYTSTHIYTYTYSNTYINLLKAIPLFNSFLLYVCVHESVPTCFFRHICIYVHHITPVEVREQLLGISFFFLSLCQSWGLNACYQSWQQMPFEDKSLCWSYKCNSWWLDDIFGYFPCLTTNMIPYL